MKVGETFLSILPWSFLIWTIITWDNKEGEYWGISVVGLAFFGTLSMEWFKNESIPDYSYDERNCNCFGIQPNGKYFSLIVRSLSLIFIIVQIFVFLDETNGWGDITNALETNSTSAGVLPDDFSKFTMWAQISSILYTFSGLILIITLCQCGKNKSKESKAEYLRWGLHDIILGCIWTALAYQFHDVVDDYDDSHWRHLFSSMIVFHIIILLFDIMSNSKYQIKWDDPTLTLWSEASKPAIKEMLRFIFYSIIYYCVLTRLHESDILLVNMTIDQSSLIAIIISCGGLMILNISETNFINNDIKKEKPSESSVEYYIQRDNTILSTSRRLNF